MKVCVVNPGRRWGLYSQRMDVLVRSITALRPYLDRSLAGQTRVTSLHRHKEPSAIHLEPRQPSVVCLVSVRMIAAGPLIGY